MSEYKDGAVAQLEIGGEKVRAIVQDGEWRIAGHSFFKAIAVGNDTLIQSVRPLVVLDLTNPAFTVAALRDTLPCDDAARDIHDLAVAALADEIEAQTKPPRIPEPGRWGVVEASLPSNATRVEFVQTRHGWTRVGGLVRETEDYAWETLVNPALIREGVK